MYSTTGRLVILFVSLSANAYACIFSHGFTLVHAHAFYITNAWKIPWNSLQMLDCWNECINIQRFLHAFMHMLNFYALCVSDLNGEVLHASVGLPPTLLVKQARVRKLELKVCENILSIMMGSYYTFVDYRFFLISSLFWSPKLSRYKN